MRNKGDEVGNRTGYKNKGKRKKERAKQKSNWNRKKIKQNKKFKFWLMRMREKPKKKNAWLHPISRNLKSLMLDFSLLAIPMLTSQKIVQKGGFSPKCSFSEELIG